MRDDNIGIILLLFICGLLVVMMTLEATHYQEVKDSISNIGAGYIGASGYETLSAFLLPDTTKILVTLSCPVKEIPDA